MPAVAVNVPDDHCGSLAVDVIIIMYCRGKLFARFKAMEVLRKQVGRLT